MTTREEKFEAERNKMLSQMGIENKEIEVEPEEVEVDEVVEPKKIDTSYHEPKEDWSDEQKEIFFAKKQAVMDDFQEDIDLLNNDPKEFDRVEKEEENALEAFENEGPVNVGHFKKYLDQFQMSWGGKGMWLPVLMILLPFSLYTWWEHNFICGLIIFVFTYCIARVFSFSLSVSIVPWILRNEMEAGPKYLVDIYEGWSKKAFSLLSPLMTVIANCPIIFIALFAMIWLGLAGYAFNGNVLGCLYKDLPVGPMVWLVIAAAHGVITWIVLYAISYEMYTWFTELAIGTSDHTTYKLRYLHSPYRVMVERAKSKGKGFISVNKRKKSFFRDYNGTI